MLFKFRSLFTVLCGLFLYFESFAQLPPGVNPGGKSWADSYQANGLCWCDSTFDHNLDNINVAWFTINGVRRNVRDVCDELQYHPLVRNYRDGDPIYNDIQCGNGPPNDADDEDQCPGRVDLGRNGCSETGPAWDVEWLASRERFGGNGETGGISDFEPDPNKTYYLDVPYHNVRLAANGSSEDAYTTSTSTTGDDVEWKFVDKGNGSWHIRRAAGGSLQGLRSDGTENADMQGVGNTGTLTYYDITTGSTSNTYFLTLPDGPAGYQRLQVDNNQDVKMVGNNRNGTWESFRITEASNSNTSSDGGDFKLVKRNATGFAVDGGSGAVAGRSVELYTNVNDANLVWTEIDRGGGYYSYQKFDTNVCLDGGSGGANGQDVTLQPCSSTDTGQQWEKIDAGSGHYRLQKRGTNFSLDGGGDGDINQNVYLWTSMENNQNQHWRFDSTSSPKAIGPQTLTDIVSVYPNPFSDVFSIDVTELESAKVSLFNAAGTLIFEETVNGGLNSFALEGLAPGLYLARIEAGTQLLVQKLIKR